MIAAIETLFATNPPCRAGPHVHPAALAPDLVQSP